MRAFMEVVDLAPPFLALVFIGEERGRPDAVLTIAVIGVSEESRGIPMAALKKPPVHEVVLSAPLSSRVLRTRHGSQPGARLVSAWSRMSSRWWRLGSVPGRRGHRRLVSCSA